MSKSKEETLRRQRERQAKEAEAVAASAVEDETEAPLGAPVIDPSIAELLKAGLPAEAVASEEHILDPAKIAELKEAFDGGMTFMEASKAAGLSKDQRNWLLRSDDAVLANLFGAERVAKAKQACESKRAAAQAAKAAEDAPAPAPEAKPDPAKLILAEPKQAEGNPDPIPWEKIKAMLEAGCKGEEIQAAIGFSDGRWRGLVRKAMNKPERDQLRANEAKAKAPTSKPAAKPAPAQKPAAPKAAAPEVHPFPDVPEVPKPAEVQVEAPTAQAKPRAAKAALAAAGLAKVKGVIPRDGGNAQFEWEGPMELPALLKLSKPAPPAPAEPVVAQAAPEPAAVLAAAAAPKLGFAAKAKSSARSVLSFGGWFAKAAALIAIGAGGVWWALSNQDVQKPNYGHPVASAFERARAADNDTRTTPDVVHEQHASSPAATSSAVVPYPEVTALTEREVKLGRALVQWFGAVGDTPATPYHLTKSEAERVLQDPSFVRTLLVQNDRWEKAVKAPALSPAHAGIVDLNDPASVEWAVNTLTAYLRELKKNPAYWNAYLRS